MEAGERHSELLTRAQCRALRGIAIVMIVVHNVAHRLPGNIDENEYSLDINNTRAFFAALSHPGYELVQQLFSFLGHYGVPLFVFLTGYGLVKKYELGSTAEVKRWPFVREHYFKLLTLIFIGMMTLFAVSALGYVYNFASGAFEFRPRHWLLNTMWWPEQASMIVNFVSNKMSRFAYMGPYWYFGFAFQLYVLYRLVLYTRRHDTRWAWLVPVAVAVLSHVAMLLAWWAGERRFISYLRYNALMGALPLAMGVLAARYERVLPLPGAWWRAAVVAVCAAAVPLMNFELNMWLLAPIAVVAGGVAAVTLCGRRVTAALAWLGDVSAMMFVLHPIVRHVFYRPGHHIDVYLLHGIYLAATVALAALYQHVYTKCRRSR